MYSGASNDFDAKVRDTVRTFHCKMQISGVTDPIEDGIFTAAINEGSTGADAYIVGSFFGPTLDVTAEPAEGIVYSGKSTAISIGLDLDDGTTEFVPMGTFIAPKASDVLRAVDLYTIHYITTAEYTLDAAYTPAITYPATASAVLTELTSKSGVAFDTSMLSATDLASEITSLYAEGQTNVTYLDAVRAVASATSSNATVKRDGSVIFVKYEDLTDDNYSIEDARLKSSSMAESMLEDLFYPGTVTFLGDPRLDPWDIVGFTDDWGEYQTLACMSLVHTYDGGLSTTVTAPSDVGEIGSLEKKVNVTAAIAEEASTAAATASTAAAQAVTNAAQAKSAAQSATTAATSALTAAQSASTAAAQALTDASTANAAANAAGISASIAQSAAEASLQSDYKDYGTRSFSDDDIETYCALGYNDTWVRTVGYYQGAVEKGQILIIHVTKTEQDNKVADLFLRAEQTEEEGGHSVNATVIGFGDTKAHFYHDNNGAHVVSEDGYRTDLDGTSMKIKNASGETVASFSGNEISLGENNVDSVIKLCGDLGEIYRDDDGFLTISNSGASDLSYITVGTYDPEDTDRFSALQMGIRDTGIPNFVGGAWKSQNGINNSVEINAGASGTGNSGIDFIFINNGNTKFIDFSKDGIFIGNDQVISGDSGWHDLTITGDFAPYDSGVRPEIVPQYRKVGKIVEVVGALAPTKNGTGSNTKLAFARLPEGYRPVQQVNIVCHGSSRSLWLLQIEKNGTLYFSRYADGNAYASYTPDHWLPFNATFMIA